MKYFCLSDTHGFFDEMKKSLDEAGFDPNNENHTLVLCGDAFDRGSQAKEIVDYLLSLNKDRFKYVRGNHEDIFFHHVYKTDHLQLIDVRNGLHKTIESLIEGEVFNNDIGFLNKALYMDKLKESKIFDLLEQMVDYFETENYIFIHGWIPVENKKEYTDDYRFIETNSYYEEWRNADKKQWDVARWSSGIEMTKQEAFHPTKTIVCGHWHALAWNEFFLDKETHDTYVSDKVIALDGMTALSKQVNCYIIED